MPFKVIIVAQTNECIFSGFFVGFNQWNSLSKTHRRQAVTYFVWILTSFKSSLRLHNLIRLFWPFKRTSSALEVLLKLTMRHVITKKQHVFFNHVMGDTKLVKCKCREANPLLARGCRASGDFMSGSTGHVPSVLIMVDLFINCNQPWPFPKIKNKTPSDTCTVLIMLANAFQVLKIESHFFLFRVVDCWIAFTFIFECQNDA